MAQDWITTTEAVTLSGYHVDHIRRLLKSGEVNGQKWGREWQVSRSSSARPHTQSRKVGRETRSKSGGLTMMV